jgi:hypothetical protein
MSGKREITRDDILPMEAYEAERKERKRRIAGIKKHRRLEVGPFATFYFESYETMWQQIHEMLYIEKGGEAQIAGELEAYNPLIPKGGELVATVMFEIEDAAHRAAVLARLGGVEETISMAFAGETIAGRPAADMDRTNEAGKASAVQFVHFSFTPEQIEKFRAPDTQVIVGFSHENYGHKAVMPESTRTALAGDFD